MCKKIQKVSCLILLICTVSSIADACTAFYAVYEGLILAGNNEDWWNPKTKMWFLSPGGNKYGRVYFGFDDFWSQGGLNDQGLFFDGFATLGFSVKKSNNKPVYKGNLIDKVMSECATVDEVLKVLDQYNLQFLERGMLMFGVLQGSRLLSKEMRL